MKTLLLLDVVGNCELLTTRNRPIPSGRRLPPDSKRFKNDPYYPQMWSCCTAACSTRRGGQAGDGKNFIQDFAGGNLIDVGAGNNSVYGGPGDQIYAGPGKNIIYDILGVNAISVPEHEGADYIFTNAASTVNGAQDNNRVARFFAANRQVGSSSVVLENGRPVLYREQQRRQLRRELGRRQARGHFQPQRRRRFPDARLQQVGRQADRQFWRRWQRHTHQQHQHFGCPIWCGRQ